MRRLFVAVAVSLALISTAQAAVRLHKTDCPVAPEAAASFKVLGAAGEYEGVMAEYQWLTMKMPGWQRTEQAQLSIRGRDFDVLYVTNGHNKRVICFDITAFYGKGP